VGYDISVCGKSGTLKIICFQTTLVLRKVLRKEGVRIEVGAGGELTRLSKRKIFVALSNLNFLLFFRSLRNCS